MSNNPFSFLLNRIAKIFSTADKTAPLTLESTDEEIDFSDEEKQAIDKMFDLFKEYAVHRSFADKLNKSLIARGLANYAEDQIMISEYSSQNDGGEDRINLAIAAIAKAYSVYQLPIYLYDLACYLESKKMHDEAKKMFKLFLVREHEYKPDQLDHISLGDRDINEARNRASEKLREK